MTFTLKWLQNICRDKCMKRLSDIIHVKSDVSDYSFSLVFYCYQQVYDIFDISSSYLGVILQVRGCDDMSTLQNSVAAVSCITKLQFGNIEFLVEIINCMKLKHNKNSLRILVLLATHKYFCILKSKIISSDGQTSQSDLRYSRQVFKSFSQISFAFFLKFQI